MYFKDLVGLINRLSLHFFCSVTCRHDVHHVQNRLFLKVDAMLHSLFTVK